MSEKSTTLFAEFSPPSYEEWVEATVKSLKGRPFEKIMSQTVEGIEIRPFYTEADLPDQTNLDSQPGQPPYRRGTQANSQPWLITQLLEDTDATKLNETLQHDLAHGQTAVFWAPEFGFNVDDIRTTLAGVDLAQVPFFLPCFHGLPLLAMLAAARPDDLAQLRGGLLHDPIAWLAMEGSHPLNAGYDTTAVLTQWAAQHAPNLSTLAVWPAVYRDCGGHAVQEIALMLATAVYHIRQLRQRNLDINTVSPRIRAVFSLGSDFFMEIAKLRAARTVWAQMMAAFDGNEMAQKLWIHALTSESNKSQLDPHVNMLRATTEAFAAALGGADSIQIAPFDARQRKPNDFSRRIARNVQIILQDEVNLARLLDPAGGSYVVEHLTDELAQRSWVLFQEIEAVGGVVAALQAGTIQQQIAATADVRQKELATRKAVMVGTNMYPNIGEKPLPQPEVEGILLTQKEVRDPKQALAELATANPANQMAQAMTAAKAGATLGEITEALYKEAEQVLVESLRPFRADGAFVRLRHWSDEYAKEHGHLPQIFLANMGPLRQHKARADFTRGFFEVGGFELIDSAGFETPEAAAQATINSGAKAVVICSTDDTYPDIVPTFVQQIKAQNANIVIILAGYPKDQIEAHKSAGIDAFIYLGADCLAINQWVQEKFG